MASRSMQRRSSLNIGTAGSIVPPAVPISSGAGGDRAGSAVLGVPATAAINDGVGAAQLVSGTMALGEHFVTTRVLVLNTGGTIGMKASAEGYVPIPSFLESLVRNQPLMNDKEHLNPQVHGPGCVTPIIRVDKRMHRRVYYEFKEYSPLMDSSNMDMSSWVRIAQDIGNNYSQWDGFVILHGTDTMSYTAAALSFMLENLGKSVVLTGAQLSMAETWSDGFSNFIGALTIAGCFVIPEVTIFFCDKLYRGNRCCKSTAFSFDAFGSPNFPSLLELGAGVVQRPELYRRPDRRAKLRIETQLNPNVGVLRIFPGITDDAVRSFLAPPMQGVVVQTYGSGNAPDNRPGLIKLLREATDRGVILINITQCSQGSVSPSYRTGHVLVTAGVLLGADMTPECALTKLSYVLAKDVSMEEKRALMCRNLRGELTVTDVAPTLRAEMDFMQTVASVMGSREEYDEIRSELHPLLLCAAARRGDLAWLKSMIEQGFNPNTTDYNNRTPLHIAAAHGHYDMADYLLSVGAHVHVHDQYGYTPLRDAVEAHNPRMVHLLRGDGAQLGMSPSDVAARLCNFAAQNQDQELRLWLGAGADVNSANFDGRTAVHVAAARGNLAALEVLLATGKVNFRLKDDSGDTSWSCAVRRKEQSAADMIARAAARQHLAMEGDESPPDSSLMLLSPLLNLTFTGRELDMMEPLTTEEVDVTAAALEASGVLDFSSSLPLDNKSVNSSTGIRGAAIKSLNPQLWEKLQAEAQLPSPPHHVERLMQDAAAAEAEVSKGGDPQQKASRTHSTPPEANGTHPPKSDGDSSKSRTVSSGSGPGGQVTLL